MANFESSAGKTTNLNFSTNLFREIFDWGNDEQPLPTLSVGMDMAAMMEQMKGMGGGMPGMDGDMGPPPDLSGAEADLAAGDDDLDDLPDLEEDNVD